jgi:hypothetical protein
MQSRVEISVLYDNSATLFDVAALYSLSVQKLATEDEKYG